MLFCIRRTGLFFRVRRRRCEVRVEGLKLPREEVPVADLLCRMILNHTASTAPSHPLTAKTLGPQSVGWDFERADIFARRFPEQPKGFVIFLNETVVDFGGRIAPDRIQLAPRQLPLLLTGHATTIAFWDQFTLAAAESSSDSATEHGNSAKCCAGMEILGFARRGRFSLRNFGQPRAEREESGTRQRMADARRHV